MSYMQHFIILNRKIYSNIILMDDFNGREYIINYTPIFIMVNDFNGFKLHSCTDSQYGFAVISFRIPFLLLVGKLSMNYFTCGIPVCLC